MKNPAKIHTDDAGKIPEVPGWTTSSWLQMIYRRRREKNDRYSMRSFAKRCGISISSLSDFFRGTKRPTPERLDEMLRKLQVTEIEAQEARLLFDLERVTSPLSKKILVAEVERMRAQEVTPP
jgi:transcriptional regulator with XRE-family HTH domain